jgi:hypothetical protein
VPEITAAPQITLVPKAVKPPHRKPDTPTLDLLGGPGNNFQAGCGVQQACMSGARMTE